MVGYVALLLLFTSLLVSCSQELLYVCPDGAKVSDATLCRGVEKVENTIVPVKEVKPVTNVTDGNLSDNFGSINKNVPKEVAKIIDKRKNLMSASYIYRINDQGYDVFSKGSSMKVYMPVPKVVLKNLDYDTIIVDLEKHTGQGYCERERYCDKIGYRLDLRQDEFRYFSPFDWLDEIESVEKISEGKIKDRIVWVVKVNGDRIYHLDYNFGIPLRVETKGIVYMYDDIVYNKVKDDEVLFSVRE